MAKSKDPLESLANKIQKDCTKRINQNRFRDADTVALSAPQLAEYTGNIHRMLTEGTRIIDRKLPTDSEARTYRKISTKDGIWDFLIPLHQGTLLPKNIIGTGAFGAVFEGCISYNPDNCRKLYAQEEAHEFLKTGDLQAKLKKIIGEIPRQITGEHRDMVFQKIQQEKTTEAQQIDDKEIIRIIEKRYNKSAPKGKICIKLSWLHESYKRMYKREKLAAGLDHKNIAYIFAVDEVKRPGNPKDKTMLTMTAQEIIDPVQTSEEFSNTGLAQRIDYAIQMGEGLRELHRIGLMHRDFKSANVLITKDNTIKIIDTGLMKKLDGKESTNTGMGEAIGSPAYFSPEQAVGGKVDIRSDIYTVGATLYEFLIGRPPNTLTTESIEDIISGLFNGTLPLLPSHTKAVNELVQKHAKEKNLTQKETARTLQDLDLIMAKMLQRDQNKRYQTIKEYLSDIRAFQKGEKPLSVYADLHERKIRPAQYVTESFSYHLGKKLKDQSMYQDAKKSKKLQSIHEKGTLVQRYLINPAKTAAKPFVLAGATIATAAMAGGTALAIAYPELAKQIVEYVAGK